MSYQIVEAKPEHLKQLRDRMRTLDQMEATTVGLTVKRALWRSYKHAIVRKTAFVDGEIACMYGVGGSVLGGIGTPWLLTTPAIEKVPFAFVREGRKEVKRMKEMFPRLEGWVLASYYRACGFIALLGFELDDPTPIGKDGVPFRRYH